MAWNRLRNVGLSPTSRVFFPIRLYQQTGSIDPAVTQGVNQLVALYGAALRFEARGSAVVFACMPRIKLNVMMLSTCQALFAWKRWVGMQSKA